MSTIAICYKEYESEREKFWKYRTKGYFMAARIFPFYCLNSLESREFLVMLTEDFRKHV